MKNSENNKKIFINVHTIVRPLYLISKINADIKWELSTTIKHTKKATQNQLSHYLYRKELYMLQLGETTQKECSTRS